MHCREEICLTIFAALVILQQLVVCADGSAALDVKGVSCHKLSSLMGGVGIIYCFLSSGIVKICW
jgi:hypothetical protein